jgi:hypothetical protein
VAIGGEGPRGTFTQVEAYDPRRETWIELTPLPEGRHGIGAVAVVQRIYLPGGAAEPGAGAQRNTLLVFGP